MNGVERVDEHDGARKRQSCGEGALAKAVEKRSLGPPFQSDFGEPARQLRELFVDHEPIITRARGPAKSEARRNPAQRGKRDSPCAVSPRRPEGRRLAARRAGRAPSDAAMTWLEGREPATKLRKGGPRTGGCIVSKIALIGLGLVGRAWAVSFARAGHEVSIWDERRGGDRRGARLRQQGPARARRRTTFSTARRRSTCAPACGAPTRSRRRSRARATSRRTRRRISRSSGASSPNSTGPPSPTRCSRVRHRRSCLRFSPKSSPAARAASSPTRSTRPI